MRSFEIIIPAYNEEENIAGLIQTIKETIGESGKITVIDDASKDKTAEIAKESGANVIRHPYRIGNGACVKTGLRRSEADIVVCMDADGQHSPQDIPELLSQTENFDMVIGSRDFSQLTSRDMANKLYNLFAGYVTLFKIQDLTSGFRAVKRREALKFLYLLPNSFSYPTTLTLSFLKTGRTIKYIPIVSSARKSGKSKINLVKDGTRFFMIILKIAIFFSPLRVFLPLSALCFCAGGLYYLYTFLNSHRFTNMSALLLTTSIIIFMLGLVSEQIAQLRLERTED